MCVCRRRRRLATPVEHNRATRECFTANRQMLHTSESENEYVCECVSEITPEGSVNAPACAAMETRERGIDNFLVSPCVCVCVCACTVRRDNDNDNDSAIESPLGGRSSHTSDELDDLYQTTIHTSTRTHARTRAPAIAGPYIRVGMDDGDGETSAHLHQCAHVCALC